MTRSSAACGSGMTSVFFNKITHREQLNELTAYIGQYIQLTPCGFDYVTMLAL